MKLYGFTGGAGMGKSLATAFLQREGIAAVDTDELAREVVAPGEPALREIAGHFGADIVDESGRLRREALAERVFADPEERRRLEAILHPLIRQRWLARTAAWASEGRPCGVVVIPLLFETEAEKNFDKVICIACSSRAQSARLRERGWTDRQIECRLAAQWPIERKMERSDFVIWNDSTEAILQEQLRRVPPLNQRLRAGL